MGTRNYSRRAAPRALLSPAGATTAASLRKMVAMSDKLTEVALPSVLQREEDLQTKACRNNRARALELLAPDFCEIGASGRVWDRSSVIELLDSQAADGREIEITGLSGRVLADGLILARWDSAHEGRRARRTSLWRHDTHGWRLVHHQGTMLLA